MGIVGLRVRGGVGGGRLGGWAVGWWVQLDLDVLV